MNTSFYAQGWRTLLRDWRSGELRLLVLAVTLAVAALTSVSFFADRLKGNLFLAHGMADDNVHFQNSAELNKMLIRAGKSFDFHMYPNSNHGIYSENATPQLYNQMTNFIFEKI